MRTVPTASSRPSRDAASAVPPAPADARQTTTTVSKRRPTRFEATRLDPERLHLQGGGRRVRELAEQPGDHESRDLADVDGVVADTLQGARDHRHVHGP